MSVYTKKKVEEDITGWLEASDLEWLQAEKKRIEKKYPVEILEKDDMYKLVYTSEDRPMGRSA